MVNNRTLSSQARRAVAATSVIRGEYIVVLRVVGELDVVSAPAIGREARRVCWSVPTTLLVDLTGGTFFGAAGLTLLVDVHRQTQLAGTELYLVAPQRIVRLLRITGLTQVFRTLDTVNEATASACESPADDSDQQLVAPAPPSDIDTRKGLLRLVSD
jgi:anti-sigma B factor antagonist